MLILKCVICIIASSGGVITAITGFNKARKTGTRGSKVASIIGITIAFCGVVYAFMGLQVNPPFITIDKNMNAVIIEGDEGAKTLYRLSTENKNDWHTYREPIKNINKSVTVLARSTFLHHTSDTSTQGITVGEYDGKLYLPDDEQEVALTSFRADFNRRDAKDGKAGNHYVGYNLKKSDFTVTGEDTNGKPRSIDPKRFTIKPTVLSNKGDNRITVTYTGSSNAVTPYVVNISANKPDLLEIHAELNNENSYVEGTKLTNDDFQVNGVYEDGERQLTTGEFTISPTDVIDGTNKIMVTSGNKSTVVKFSGTSENAQSEEEEPNDDYRTANLIALNSTCAGHIGSDEDIDFFKINVTDEKGWVVIHFGHEKFDDTGSCWKISFFSDDSDGDPLVQFGSSGTAIDTPSSKIRLTKGLYYIKVERDSYPFRNDDYWIKPEYQKCASDSETEPNDDFTEANEIKTNVEYEGNLTNYYNRQDNDYYKFTLPDKGKISVHFQHKQEDKEEQLWRVEMYGASQDQLLEFYPTGIAPEADSNSIRVPKGEYYIKVFPYSSVDDTDYKLEVEFKAEGSEAEAEPNNDFAEANPINGSIVGNLNGNNNQDKDFYYVDVRNGSLNITFDHQYKDSEEGVWLYSVIDSNGNEMKDVDNNDYVAIKGNESSVTKKWNNLPTGRYYIRVSELNDYDNMDYKIGVT